MATGFQVNSYNRPQMISVIKNVISDQRKGEMCWTLRQSVKDITYLNKYEMTENMKVWRKLKKQGEITMPENQNISVKIDGNKFHILAIKSPYEDDSVPAADPTIATWDRETIPKTDLWKGLTTGYFEYSTGYIYYFKSQNNRDMVYKYVMGIKD
jgi:hypothetical protein